VYNSSLSNYESNILKFNLYMPFADINLLIIKFLDPDEFQTSDILKLLSDTSIF
jgi:hypothetical protein